MRTFLVLLIAMVATTSVVVPVGTATAKPAKKHNIERPYSKNWVFRSTKLNRCVFITVSGSMTGTWQYLYGDASPDKDSTNWTNMRLKNPTVTAEGWPILGAGCDSTRRWRMKADLSQGWYQAGCDLDVSVSVGYPWSVSATPTYSCGDNKVGHRTSTEGFARSTLSQFNTGFPISFASVAASKRGGGVGFKGVITVRAHTKKSSDAVRKTINLTLNRR